MQSRLLSPTSILGLSLGALVFATTLQAKAEPNQPVMLQEEANPISADAAAKASAKATEAKATELKTRTVTLAADTESKGRGINKKLLATSGTLFAVGYVPAVITALANSKGTSGWLGVPVVGPWVDWGPHTSPGNKALLFGSGLLQGVGLIGTVASFFVPESKTKNMRMGHRKVNVSPVAGGGVYTLNASGRF